MEEHILDVDSSQRDPTVYPNPNDYVVYLNKRLYNVESIRIVSGKIPTTQYLINNGNRNLQVDDTELQLPVGNYSNGHILASNLQTALVDAGTNVTGVSFRSNTNTLVFTGSDDFTFKFYSGSNGFSTNTEYGSPASVLGFTGEDVTSTGQVLESGYVDLLGPTNLIVLISTDDEDCRTKLFTTNNDLNFDNNTWGYTNVHSMTNLYTGRMNIFRDNNYNTIDFKHGDPIEYKFNKCSDKIINRLRIRWFYNVGNKLIPYEFNNRNHYIKIGIKASDDKLTVLPRVEHVPAEEQDDENITEESSVWTRHSKIRIAVTSFIILILIIFIWSRRTRVSLEQ